MSKLRARLVFMLWLVIVLVSGLFIRPAAAQNTTDRKYFPETGHVIQGAFYLTYVNTRNADILYGFPVTDEYVTALGDVIQYFQRAVFRRDANSTVTRIEKIGSESYRVAKFEPVAGVELARDHPACYNVNNASPLVCYAFKDFYLAYDGVNRFGLPLSSIVSVNGRLVQYFEFARFEWHPELPSGKRVTLTNLGYHSFLQRNESPERLRPRPDTNAVPGLPLALRLATSATHGTVEIGAEQRVYVVVRDQALQPIESASVTIKLRFPSGNETSFSGFTDKDGIAYSPVFSQPDEQKGRVLIEVEVTVAGLTKTTRSSYTVW